MGYLWRLEIKNVQYFHSSVSHRYYVGVITYAKGTKIHEILTQNVQFFRRAFRSLNFKL